MPPLLTTIIGLVVLVGGAYILVEGASRIAKAFGISDLVVGLTVVAIGTSAPELAIVVASALNIESGALALTEGSNLIIGNVVGSNIANIGLILGFSAVTATLAVPQNIIRRDFAWLAVITAIVGMMAWDGEFRRPEGMILIIFVVAFSIFQYRIAAKQSRDAALANSQEGAVAPAGRDAKSISRNLAMVLAGIVGLAFGSDWLVEGATIIAKDLGVSEYLIGLTLLAVGTSLPELATSIVGAMKSEGELIVGNIIGSNIYNLILVLAAGMIITDLQIPDQVRTLQIPLMIGLTFALLPIFATGGQVHRREGLGLLGAYILITVLAVAANPG